MPYYEYDPAGIRKSIRDDKDVVTSLFYTAIGKTIVSYANKLTKERIGEGMHDIAVQMLEEIYEVLENEELEDPDCVEKIEGILEIYFHRLEVRSSRHIEMD